MRACEQQYLLRQVLTRQRCLHPWVSLGQGLDRLGQPRSLQQSKLADRRTWRNGSMGFYGRPGGS
jgi:hypothetical protein